MVSYYYAIYHTILTCKIRWSLLRESNKSIMEILDTELSLLEQSYCSNILLQQYENCIAPWALAKTNVNPCLFTQYARYTHQLYALLPYIYWHYGSVVSVVYVIWLGYCQEDFVQDQVNGLLSFPPFKWNSLANWR